MRPQRATMRDAVAAIVLNWNSYEDTSRCVQSLLALEYDDLSLVVVDNGSTDDSADRLETTYETVTVVRNETNRGFGGGMNAGIKYALDEQSVDYLWLLNNDVLLEDSDILKQLVSTIQSGERVGVVSPLVEEPDGSVWFERGYVDPRTGDCGHTRGNSRRALRIENEYIPTCCALVDAGAVRGVGAFDEQYFIYYDDVDHCLRLREEGWRLLTDTTVSVTHEGSATSERIGGTIFPYYMARNWIQLFRKHDFEKAGFLLTYTRWFGLQLLNRTSDGDFRGCLALFWGLSDGLRGRRGKGRYP